MKSMKSISSQNIEKNLEIKKFKYIKNFITVKTFFGIFYWFGQVTPFFSTNVKYM